MNTKQERKARFSVAPPAIDKCSPFHAEENGPMCLWVGARKSCSFLILPKAFCFSSSLKKIYIHLRWRTFKCIFIYRSMSLFLKTDAEKPLILHDQIGPPICLRNIYISVCWLQTDTHIWVCLLMFFVCICQNTSRLHLYLLPFSALFQTQPTLCLWNLASSVGS